MPSPTNQSTTNLQSPVLPGITVGFATAVAMWGIGYLTHLGGAWAPPALVFMLLAAALAFGGFLAARMTPAASSWKPTLIAGLTTSLINFLILGSVLANPAEGVEPLRANWPLIALGSILAQTFLMMLGGHFGARAHPTDPNRKRTREWWLSRFAIVAALSALPVILSGGLVTSAGAGMAVPDWPASFGDNMFLFSLSKMTGGIYFEHAHRLFGSLVGFTTVVLTLICASHSRSKPAAFAAFFLLIATFISSFFLDGLLHNLLPTAGMIGALIIAFRFCGWRYGIVIFALSLVVLQGILGGIRVLVDSTPLAMVHGITGQLTFALLCLLGAFLSPLWRTADRTPGDKLSRTLALTLAIVVVFQMILGAGIRHFGLDMPMFLHPHILGAIIIVVLAPMAGFRTKAKHADRPPLKQLGSMVVHTMGLQFVLGGLALWVVIANRDVEEKSAIELVIRTAHQATGALLLAFSALLAAWSLRLISTPKTPAPE